MNNFSTSKQKISKIWNTLYSNNNLLNKEIRIDEETSKKIDQALRDLTTEKVFIDFSTDWEDITNTNYIHYQIIFDSLNINYIPFLRLHLAYVFGDPNSNTPVIPKLTNLINTFVNFAEFNTVIQLIDIPTQPINSLVKKVIVNKSYLVSYDPEASINLDNGALKVRLLAEFFNPQEFI